ncbi:MAG: DUF1553 domain-containing protein, partial [Bryobacteraceae bacterium]
STPDAAIARLPDHSLLAQAQPAGPQSFVLEAQSPLDRITAVRIEALPDASLPRGGPGRDLYGNVILTRLLVEIDGRPVTFGRAETDDSSRDQVVRNLIEPASEYGVKGWGVDASRDEVRLARTAVLALAAPLAAPLEVPRGAAIRVTLKHEGEYGNAGVGRFRISLTASPDPMRITSISARLRPLLSLAAAVRTSTQADEIGRYYASIAPENKPERDRIAALNRGIDKLEIPTTLVMRERPSAEPPSTFLRVRGSFLSKGEKVATGVPSFLHALPAGAPPSRLGLAQWLTSPENPLAARVAVNRFWEQIFGLGLVETSEDFGSQGERPTHPDLLDWLAVE